jgi:hypothetical protein
MWQGLDSDNMRMLCPPAAVSSARSLCRYFAGPSLPIVVSTLSPSTNSPIKQRPRIAGPSLETGALPNELWTCAVNCAGPNLPIGDDASTLGTDTPEKQRARIAGPSLQTSALPLGYGAVRGRNFA